MSKVLITGATGLIGTQLCELLTSKGFEVLILSRGTGKSSKYPVYEWNLQKDYINEEVFSQKIDFVVHLAGAGIADKRWTDKRKRLIIDSRVQGIALLKRAIEKAEYQPKAFISASAVGIYGDRGEEEITEESAIPEASDAFLVKSCLAWEQAVDELAELGLRTAKLRVGIVLSTQGGALAKMLPSYKVRTGAYFGNGQQYYPWIHLEDVCRMFAFLIEQEDAQGVYNGVGPEPVRNKTLAKAIGKAKGFSPLVVPAPAFAMRMAMGEMADIVLHGAKVLPKRLQAAGFEYKHPELIAAVQHLLKHKM